MKIAPIAVACCIIFFCTLPLNVLADEIPLILGNAQDGEAKAALCLGCHGLKGEGKAFRFSQARSPLTLSSRCMTTKRISV